MIIQWLFWNKFSAFLASKKNFDKKEA